MAQAAHATGKHQRVGLQVVHLQHIVGGAELVQHPARVFHPALAHEVVQQRLVVAGAFLAAQVPAVPVGAGLLGTDELAGDVGGGCVGHGLIDSTVARERRGSKWVRGRARGEQNLARRERGHGHS